MPAIPIADSSAPMVVGIRHTSSATRHHLRLRGIRVDGERLQRDDREQEDQRQRRQQQVERDLVGVFWRADPSTRAIMRSRKVSPG